MTAIDSVGEPSPFHRRLVLPLAVFFSAGLVHYLWTGFFPEGDPVQDRWLAVSSAANISWFARYVETDSYWLGLSYALSLSFAASVLRRYREQRVCTTRRRVVAGVSLPAFVAAAGCYLIGCCGSPMLAVYLSIFGARFLPLGKPLIALLTAIFIATAWWWMNRHPGSRQGGAGE